MTQRWWKLTLAGMAAVSFTKWLWSRYGRPKTVGALPPPPEPAPDPVDQAIYESFPASDPPSWAGGR